MKHTFSTARLLSFVMVLAVLLTAGIVLGINVSAEDTTATEVGTEAELIAALTAGGDVQLTANIQLTATATISVAANTTLSSKQDDTVDGTEIFTITRSQTTGFSMFTVAAGVTFTLENVTLEGGNFEDTNSKTYGGAIRNSGTFVILGEGTTIQNFRAARGGAVYGKVVLLDGSLLTGNYASYGGGAIVSNTVWMMPGAVIEKNHTDATGFGGAIWLDSGGKLYMRGGIIRDNTSERFASAIDTNGNFSIYIAGGTIINNTTHTTDNPSYPACGILLRKVTASWASLNFGTNYTTNQPAAVSGIAPEASVQIYNNSLANISYHVNLDKTVFAYEHVKFNANLSAESRIDYSVATVTVPETSEGAADGYTAKHYSLTSAIADALVRGVSEITLERFDEGKAVLSAGTYTVNGGGNTFKRVVSGASMFTVPAGANATFTNITLDGNSIVANGENGGAFNVAEGATLTLTGKDAEKVTVSGFEAALGGAIYTKGTLNVTDAVITENNATSTASNSGGGGIFVAGGTVTVDGATEITGNTAVTAGGGIGAMAMAGNKAYITVKGNATVDGNTATNGGGACISSHSSLTLSGNAVLSNNFVSSMYGGGIYIPAGTVVLEENASITGNYLTREAWAVGEGVSMQNGTFVMTGGSITNNGKGGADSYNNWHHGGALYATAEAKIWILGGTVSGNEASNAGAAFSVSHADAKLYILGGTVTGNLVGGTTANNVGNGSAIYTGGTVYLLGGSITENGIQTTEQLAYVADIVTSETGALHLGSSVTPDSIPDAVAAYAETEAGKAIFEIVDGVVTSKNPLTVADGGVGANTPKNISGTIYVGDLVEGSKVVFEDNTADLGYFAALDTGYTTLSNATLAAIQLKGADEAYNAKIEDGKLVWPTHQYLIVGRSAGLRDDILLRLYVVKRDSDNATAPVIEFAGKTIEWQNAKVDEAYAANIPQAGNYIGTYYIEVPMSPKQITEAITVTYGEDDVQTRTFAGYLDDAQALAAESSALKALIVATRNYCTAAQGYFNYKTDDLANENYQSEIADIDAASGMALNQFADTTLPRFQSARVVLEDKVSVKIIIKQWVENFQYSVTLGGETYTPTTAYDEANGLYMIVIENISACDLENRIVVTMTDGENTATLDYSVLEYAINKQGDTEGGLDYVAKALYAYANAAAAYVAAN